MIFFSAAWGTIKWIDERTDSKVVFFLPAGLLLALILSTTTDSFTFFVCTFLTAPIITMLIVVGIQQGNPLFLKDQNQTYIRHQTFGRPRRSEKKAPKRDLHRKLAPSYIRAYDRLIAYIQANGGEIRSREDGIERLEKIGLDTTAEIFFSSPYVLKVLGLEHKSQVDDENRTSNEEVIGDEWWEEGYKVKSESNPSDNTETGNLCGHPGCENTVSAFDFRCYTCRGRFCPQHVGPNINCQLCSD